MGFFFVDKRDKTLCPWIDYRGLNHITKNKYHLPLNQHILLATQPCYCLYKVGPLQRLSPHPHQRGDEWKTAFNNPLGHFKYQVLPFGLTNAPAVFQVHINDVLRDMLNWFVFVYLDNNLIFSSSIKEYIQHVWLVLVNFTHRLLPS